MSKRSRHRRLSGAPESEFLVCRLFSCQHRDFVSTHYHTCTMDAHELLEQLDAVTPPVHQQKRKDSSPTTPQSGTLSPGVQRDAFFDYNQEKALQHVRFNVAEY